MKNNKAEIKTVNDYLNYLLEYFDTDNCRPGKIMKGTLIYTILGMIREQNPITVQTAKIKAMEANNITEFIVVIKTYFDCNHVITINLEDLQDKTEQLCKTISLKLKQAPVKVNEAQAELIAETSNPDHKTKPELKKTKDGLGSKVKRIFRKGGKNG